MATARYYARALCKWGWVVIGQAIGGVVQGFLSLTDSPWHIIPLQGWLTMLIVGLALAPYFAFRNVHKGLMAIRNARPALSVRSEPYNRSTKGPTYTHIDIMNKPEYQTQCDVAEDVVCYVTFYRTDGNPEFPEIMGVWADAPEAARLLHGGALTVSYLIEANQKRLSPNESPRSLSVLLKYKEDNKCYEINPDSCAYYPDRRNEKLELAEPSYVVKLWVKGTNTQKEFVFLFDLNNPGSGEEVQLKLRRPSAFNKSGNLKEYPVSRKRFHGLL